MKKPKKNIKKIAKVSPKPEKINLPKIKVIGIGGGGGSIVGEIAKIFSKKRGLGAKKIDFVVANVDSQAILAAPQKVKKFCFGQKTTFGLGCGMDPEIGERAAKLALEQIKKMLSDADLCIFVSCFGGGTGSGATPVFSQLAQSLNSLSIGIFTMPFKFEGHKRQEIAKNAVQKTESFLNGIVIIPNQKIFQVIDQKTPLKEALSSLNKILAQTLGDLVETVYDPGIINLDFADFKTIFKNRGEMAFLDSEVSFGKDRAKTALEKILKNPLLDYKFEDAHSFIFNIISDDNLTMKETEEISRTIYQFNPRARIIFGVSRNSSMKNKIKILLLALASPKNKIIAEKKSKIKEVEKEANKEIEKEAGKKLFKKEKTPAKPQKKEKLKKEEKKESQEKPSLSKTPSISQKLRVRRNGLDLHKIMKESEEALLKEEEQWEVPAFLRKK